MTYFMHTLVHLPTIIKEASICSRQGLTLIPTTVNVLRLRDYGSLSSVEVALTQCIKFSKTNI